MFRENTNGSLDLLIASEPVHLVSVLLGNGDATFRLPLEFRVGREPRFLLPGDLDLDGDVDMVSLNHNSNDVTVLLIGETRTLPRRSGMSKQAFCLRHIAKDGL